MSDMEKKEKQKIYSKNWYQKNKEKIITKSLIIRNTKEFKEKRKIFNHKRKELNRDIYYKTRYNGFTVKDYEQLLKLQNNKCAICGLSHLIVREKNTYFHVDHCHSTGKIRGLLCNNCNISLGLLKDNIETIKNMVIYLEKI